MPLQPGQSVIIEPDRGVLAQISLSLYLIPSLGLLLGAFAAYSTGLGDGMQAVAGLSGLLTALGLVRLSSAVFFRQQTPLCVAQPTDN